ncbi:MAG: DegT/DnrJ/EryC1/StrS family aminotransferase [Rhizobiaceae bacterium]
MADFEAAFGQALGQSHAIAFPYGRTGLLLLIEALGIRGREIILPAYTCVVVAHAIVISGNRPVFVDSEPGGFNMDLDQAEAAITPDTAAILATSIHGYPVDLDRLAALRSRHPDVRIIQDCAHSFGARWNGELVNRAGIAAVFGLNISKIMTSIFGGMVTTDDADLAQALRDVRDRRLTPGGRGLGRAAYLVASTTALSPPVFGVVQWLSSLGLLDRFVSYYDETLVDMPSGYLAQIGRAEASVGVVQSKAYEDIVRRRQAIAQLYDSLLRPRFAEALPPIVEGATYSHYVMRVADPDGLRKQALKRGIELGRVIDYSIPDMPAYREMSAAQGPFEETRRLNRSVINVPIWVDEARARRIAGILHGIA